MPPVSLVALVIVVLVVLPGSMYTWAFERQVSGFGLTSTDRIFRFIAVSMIFHLAAGWAEYGVYRSLRAPHKLNSGQFALVWMGVLIIVTVPAFFGSVLGGLYATKSTRSGWRWFRRVFAPRFEDKILQFALGRAPAPRAWDHFLSARPNVYLRIRTTDNKLVAGRFADQSYAGGFPYDADLFLEEAWTVNQEGVLGEAGLGYSIYIPASQISIVEIVPQE